MDVFFFSVYNIYLFKGFVIKSWWKNTCASFAYFPVVRLQMTKGTVTFIVTQQNVTDNIQSEIGIC